MSKFCNICASILIPSYMNDEASFNCVICKTKVPFVDEDTLRYSNVKENNILIHEKLLKNSIHDPAKNIIVGECPKCEYHLISRVRIGVDMILYNICIKCEHTWVN